MNDNRSPEQLKTARRTTVWISVAVAIFVGGTAYFTGNPVLWSLAGLALASGLGLTAIGKRT